MLLLTCKDFYRINNLILLLKLVRFLNFKQKYFSKNNNKYYRFNNLCKNTLKCVQNKKNYMIFHA